MDKIQIEKDLRSRDENRRWQAAIKLGEYVESRPAAIWPLVVKYGSYRNSDVRMAIATCVLEHILEHHFNTYFRKVKQIVDSGNHNFADTLTSCWKFGQSELPTNAKRLDKLIEEIRIGRRPNKSLHRTRPRAARSARRPAARR
jgi:hypothetical protein